MTTRLALGLSSIVVLAACSCGAPAVTAPPPPTSTPPTMPSFEVHEWGLVRGTLDDHVMISGPHGPDPVVVMAKPVLYFHREAARETDAALRIDVEVTIPDGRVVVHWPPTGATGSSLAWRDVLVQDGSCHGSHYPTLAEAPCAGLADGCEASTLAGVETTDSDCAYWPRPPGDDGPTQAWNHLFYRAERTTAPPLPLRLEPQPDGTLRVTATGTDAVPGRLIRMRRANGMTGIVDGVAIVAPPAPGATITVEAPAAPLSGAAATLGESLRAAGLTDDEIAAFRRAWDDTLFGPNLAQSAALPSVTATLTTSPVVAAAPMPVTTTSVLYVLPLSSVDALSTLHITPAPSVVRRAIVVWVDERNAS
jgi:hypothetical protein